MAKTASLNVSIGAETKRLRSELKKANSMMGKFKSSLKGIGGAMAAAFAVGSIVNFTKEAVNLYNIQAKAEAKLLTALNNREDVYKRLTAHARELQGVTLFGDEETIEAQAFLAAMGLNEQAIIRLIPLIQDLATKANMNLTSAADLVAKSVGSSTNALSRYGVEIKGAVGSVERLESAIKGLNDQVGGQSVAAANSGIGALSQLSNAWGDLKEELGKDMAVWLVPLAKMATEFLSTKSKLNELRDSGKRLAEQRHELEKQADSESVSFSKAAKVKIAAIDEEIEQIKKLMNEVAKYGDTLENINKKTEGAPGIDTDKIKDEVTKLDETRKLLSERAADRSSLGNPEMISNTENFTTTVSDLSEAHDRLAESMEKVSINSAGMVANIGETKDVFIHLGKLVTRFGATVVTSLGEDLGNAMAGVGNFGESMLKSVGNFMKQLGGQLISLGFAKLEFDKWFAVPGGAGVAIVAGTALVAAGQAAIASFSQKNFSGGGSYGGGGGSFSSSTSTGIVGLTNDEPIKLEGDFVIRGNDLVAVIDKQNYTNSRTGGRTIGG